MNGCPDIIDIIALTEDHDKVSPQVAAHVYCCPECREILEDAIETRDCDWQPTFADLKDAERAAASLFAAGSDIVGEILSFVIGKLNGKAFLSLLTEPLPHLQRRQSESFAGGAGLRRRPERVAQNAVFDQQTVDANDADSLAVVRDAVDAADYDVAARNAPGRDAEINPVAAGFGDSQILYFNVFRA